MPAISVILPVYNTEQYLARCIESIAHQTFSDFEVIIVDDASTDNSWNVLKNLTENDERFKIYQNSKNQGVSATLNHAVRYSQSDYIARMDSDDIMLPQRLELQYKYILNHPECAILGGQVKYIDVDDHIHSESDLPLRNQEIKYNLYRFQPFADSTVLFNLNRIPRGEFWFDENFRVAEGLDLYFRLLDYGEYKNLENYIVLLRNRPDSLSIDIKKNFSVIAEIRNRAMKIYNVKAPPFTQITTLLQKFIIRIMPFCTVHKLLSIFKKWIIRN